MQLPPNPTPKPDLERRREIVLEILREMESALHRSRFVKFATQVLFIALTLCGIIFTYYTIAFSQEGISFKNLLWGSDSILEVRLSEVMRARNPPRVPVYVLILDASYSLKKKKLSNNSLDTFYERLLADGINIPQNCKPEVAGRLSMWDLAKLQLCCYIDHLEEDSYVGLWTVGTDAEPISRALLLESSRENLEVPAKKQLMAELMEIPHEPADGDTNFKTLLVALEEHYIKSSNFLDKYIHFIIASDFLHDVGPSDDQTVEASMEEIEASFESIVSSGRAMFHLISTEVANNQNNSVISFVRTGPEWSPYQLDSLMRLSSDPRPDFLFKFVPSSEQLTFYNSAFSPGVNPVHLVWDVDMPNQQDDNKVMVGLLRKTGAPSSSDVDIYVAEGRHNQKCGVPPDVSFEEPLGDPKVLTAVHLKAGQRRELTIRTPGDHLCVEPTDFDKEMLNRYRITLSQTGKDSDRRTYVVELKFQRFIPRPVSVVFLVCVVSVFASVLCLIVAAIKRPSV